VSGQDQRPTSDLVDQAADTLRQALRDTPVPAGPPDDLAAATIEALRSRGSPPDAARRGGRRAIVRLARYGGLAAAALLLAAAGASLWLLDRSAPPAFGQVVDNVKKARSVTFTLRQKLTPQSPTLEQKWYLQGDAARLEIPGTQGDIHSDLPVLMAVVVDYRRKKAVELDFVHKTARERDLSDRMARDFSNPIEGLRRLTDKDAERVGEDQLDGRKMLVYRLKRLDFLGMKGTVEEGETAKVWVDAASALPARIVIEAFTADRKGQSSLIFEKFAWNEPLAANLFRLDVPEGFTPKGP
jgi:outer membrane lipoprotein-sorting protein